MSIRRNKNTIKQRKRRMEKNLYSLHVINKKMALNKYYYKSQRYLYSFIIVIYIVLFYALHRAVALFC